MKSDRSFFFQTKEKDTLQTSNSNNRESSPSSVDRTTTSTFHRTVEGQRRHNPNDFQCGMNYSFRRSSVADLCVQLTVAHLEEFDQRFLSITNARIFLSRSIRHRLSSSPRFSSQIYQTDLDDLQQLADVKATMILNGRDKHSKKIQSQLEPKSNDLRVRLVSLISSRFDSNVRLWNIEYFLVDERENRRSNSSNRTQITSLLNGSSASSNRNSQPSPNKWINTELVVACLSLSVHLPAIHFRLSRRLSTMQKRSQRRIFSRQNPLDGNFIRANLKVRRKRGDASNQ